MQLDLFSLNILEGIEKTQSTTETYAFVAEKMGISKTEVEEKVDAGKGGQVSAWKRKVRWIQQTLKMKGLVENTGKGKWQVTKKGKRTLTAISRTELRIAFYTPHGVVLWGHAEDLGGLFCDEVNLIITSSPFLLSNPKEYGGIRSEQAFIDDFLFHAEIWRKMLIASGSLVVNLGDAFKPGGYAQSLYKERLLIALEENLGLQLAQRFEWWSPNKLPNPIDPVCKRRTHVVPALESFFWLTPCPEQVKSNNRAVLVEYAQSTQRLIEKGARKAGVRYRPSGAKIDEASFAVDNGGAIPHNILCDFPEAANSGYVRYCREHDLPIHPARYPVSLPEFFIKLLTDKGDIVVDPYLGSATTGLAAEKHERHWIGTERIREYILGAMGRFAITQTGTTF